MGRKIGENKSQMALRDKKGREHSEGKMAFKLWKIGRILGSQWNGSDRGY